MSGAFKRRRTRSASLLHFSLVRQGLEEKNLVIPIGGNGVRVQFRASKNGVAVFFSRREKSFLERLLLIKINYVVKQGQKLSVFKREFHDAKS